MALGDEPPRRACRDHLHRQKLPVIDRDERAPAYMLARGAYVLADPEDGEPEAIVIATGTEVQLALEAQARLAETGVRARVVAMPSWEIFAAQEASYREEVLPPEITARVAIGIDRFGASAPGETNLEKFGFTPGRVVEAVRQVLKLVPATR